MTAVQSTVSSPPSRRTEGAGRRQPSHGLLVLYLSLGGLSFAVLQSLVAPALATIGSDLGAATNDAAWVLTAYLLSAAVLTPVLGRLGDMVGKRRMLIVVLSLLLAGTVLAALAPNLGVLIVARAIQGSAGAIMPLSIGVVRDELPHDRISVTIGFLSAIFGIGAGVGIVAAGPIVENLSWHWLFWLPTVLIVVALLGTIFGMTESPVKKPGRLDLVGTGILTVALVSLLLAISQGQSWGWGSLATVGLLALGAITLVAFVLVELRVKNPLIDVRLFAIRGVWTAHVIALALGFAMFGTFVLMPTLLQLPASTDYGFGASVTASGLFLLPTVVMMVIFGPVSGAVINRFGPKPPMVFAGMAVTAAFILPAIAHGALWQLVVSGVLVGIGIGVGFAAISNALIESVPAAQTGEAISVNSIARTIGSSVGTAVIAALIATNSSSQGLPVDSAFTIGFWVCAAVALLAAVAAVAAPSMRKRREQALALGVDDFPQTDRDT